MVFALQLLFMFASLTQLSEAGLFNAPILLVFAVGLLAVLALHKQVNRSTSLPKADILICIGAAAVFTLMILAAYYPVWLEPSLGAGTPKVMKLLYGFVMLCVCGLGTWTAFFSIFRVLALAPDRYAWKQDEAGASRWTPKNVFWCSFLCICAVNLFVLFFLKYPGLMEGDSYNQIGQVLSGRYHNHHPVFHTIMLKPCIAFGLAVFQDINAGIAIYSTCQVLIMAAVFSYVLFALAQLRVPRLFIILAAAYYAFSPFHILLSITVYKDVFFSGCVTIFCLKQFQLLEREDNSFGDYAAYVLSAIGSCLLRSNGMIAIVITAMIFVLCYGKKRGKLLLLLLMSVALSFCVKHMLLSALSIPQPDTMESLSIPTQQIVRTIIDHNDLTESEYALVSQMLPIEDLSDIYCPDFYDPIKNTVRQALKQSDTIEGWPGAYVGLYLRLGLRHPITYIKAWIDQTKGYWCSGYTVPIWFINSFPNDLGLHHTILLPKLSSIFDYVMGCFDDFGFFEPLLSPGFCTWLGLLALCYAVLRKDRAGILLTIPGLAVLATLLLATPMANEFHYYYSAFCTLPIVLVLVTRDRRIIR